ncbi:hypothetical protein ACFLTA_07960 [Bacteroidota bacterium]
MKNKILISLVTLLGVFLMLDAPLLAQSTGDEKPDQQKAEYEAQREASRERTKERSSRASEIFVAPYVEFSDVSTGDRSFVYTTGSSNDKNSRLTLSKRYSGQSAEKTGTFQMEKGVKKIRLQIEGRVTVGKIQLELYLPGKESLTKITIDDSADIAWSKTINVAEDETKYFGDWTYTIKAESVEGHYQMSISTY